MRKAQQQVEEFHKAMEVPIPHTIAFRNCDLRKRLIEEEVGELLGGIYDGDMVATIDGICDSLFVILGTAIEFGIDIQPFWNEVCRSNMTKAGGGRDENGKVKKPSWYEPPKIKEMLK